MSNELSKVLKKKTDAQFRTMQDDSRTSVKETASGNVVIIEGTDVPYIAGKNIVIETGGNARVINSLTNLIAGENVIVSAPDENGAVTISTSGGISEVPQATETNTGGIKAAERTTESSEVKIDPTTGKLYVPESEAEEYVLPQATEEVLGGVKAKAKTTESGEVVIDGATGKLYAPSGGEPYTLPQATGSTLGGVKAKAKTSETGEVAIDGATGKLFSPESSYSLPQADATTLGGIKAKEKTSETMEVAIESATGKLFVPAPDEAANGIPAGGTAGHILSKVDGTDYNAQWVGNPSAFSVAVAGGYSGDEEDFETDLASIEGLAAAIAEIVGV